MSSVGAQGAGSSGSTSLDDALTYLYSSKDFVEPMEVNTPKEVVMQQIEDVRKDFVGVKKLITMQKNQKSAEKKLTNLIFRLDDITTTDEEETQDMLTLLAEIQECLKKVQSKEWESSEESDFEVVTIEEQEAPFVQTGSIASVSEPESGESNNNGPCRVNNKEIPASQPEALDSSASTLYSTCNMDSDQLNLTEGNVPGSSKDHAQDCPTQVGNSPIIEEGQDSALQLLLQDAQGKFHLNKEALDKILSDVKDRKLVIVSIVGAFRRGKSFLLNFLLRYLKAGGAANWMETASKLTGFPWRSGMGRVTTGILMWSKPFLINDDTAVLLMDTQGSFDSQTSMEENTFIFSLSTMISSVQIYNLHERIQMDDLQNLQYFMEFGRLTEDDCHAKSFQKLVLLVRDWMFSDTLQYGYLGGEQLLTQWFQGRAGRGMAEMIQTCYEQVKCCLLPHPGEAVTYHKHFTGALSDLRPEFVDQLQMFVESILDPRDLPAKKIGGVCVTGEELQAYLSTYVEHLQSPSLKPKTLFQALSNTCNERARKKALSYYVREMEAQLTLTQDVVALHQRLQMEAMEQFDAWSSLGGDKDTNPQRQFLLEMLQEKFENLLAQHKKRKEEEAKEARYQACHQLSEVANRIGTKYRQAMDMQCLSTDGLSPEKLQEIHDDHFKQALDGFVPYLKLYPLDVCCPYIDQAKLDMQGHFAICKVREEGKLKQKKEAELEKTRLMVQENYQKTMEQYGVEKGAVDGLQLTHEKASAQALDHLEVMDDGTEEFKKHLKCAKQVINSRWRIYNSRNENLLKLHSDQEAMILTLLLKDAQRSYELAMVNLCNAKVTTSELEVYHVNIAKSCVLEFEEKAKQINPGKVEDFVEQLEKELKVKFDDMEELHARKISEAREQESKRPSKANYAIGIDLGTTNCCVAVYQEGKVSIIRNNVGMNTTPSTVFFGDKDQTFGETAIYKGYDEPKNYISEMKRIIGRRFDDPTVQSLIPRFCFNVNEDENGWPVVAVEKGEKRTWKPEEISGLVLGEMRRLASVHLDSEVFDAVVTIPAYFNELQREATKRACAQAGLNVLRIINEPTAAAIAYGIQEPSERSRKVLVFDFGGGTCDVSILQMERNQYTVLSSHGDNKLGGEDFDDLLMDHLVQSFEKKHPGLKLDATDKRRLRRQCERAKRELGNHQSTEVVVKRITDSKTSFRETVTRRKFQSLICHLFPRVLNPVKQCLMEAKLKPSEINEVVLVGGSSCMKSIQNLLQKYFRSVKLHRRINPDEAIAYGAAIQAAISSGKYGENPPIIKDITPLSLGVEERGIWLEILIPKNTQLPAKITERFQTYRNFQQSARIKVYQGENKRAKQNTLLGTFTLNDLRRALADEVQIDVTFNIDIDGILVVSAVEVGTKNAKQITITRANGTRSSAIQENSAMHSSHSGNPSNAVSDSD